MCRLCRLYPNAGVPDEQHLSVDDKLHDAFLGSHELNNRTANALCGYEQHRGSFNPNDNMPWICSGPVLYSEAKYTSLPPVPSLGSSRYVRLSKRCGTILRHSANRLGIHRGEGFVHIRDLAIQTGYKLNTESMLQMQASDSKGRFDVDRDYVRATQGHTFDAGLAGAVIDTVSEFAHHATTAGSVSSILSKGLLRQGRQTVHTLPGRFIRASCSQERFPGKLPNERWVVHIDVEKCRAEGNLPYRSLNGYLLFRNNISRHCIFGATKCYRTDTIEAVEEPEEMQEPMDVSPPYADPEDWPEIGMDTTD